jgi:serine/threonine protein kinase
MSHPQASDESSLVGRVIQDRFRIVQRIGAGGMGAVYLAEQLPLGRKVALKVLELAGENQGGSKLQFQERFLLEAAAVAKLAHPNTIILYDYGRTDEGHYYYAMELVEGPTLSQLIRERTYIDPRHAIHISAQICGSLRDAHDAGLVHRDLKPGNVMLTRRGDDTHFVKVLDFGLVKQIGGDASQELTRSGIVLGSPRYMAPEQIESRNVDHRTDIYAFGCVLYHMLAGAPPFMYGSQFETLRAQVDEPPPPLEQRNPWCDAGPTLRQLMYACLAKRPEQRPQTMADVQRGLRACAQEIGISLSSLSSTLDVPAPSGPVTLPDPSAAHAGHSGHLHISQASLGPSQASYLGASQVSMGGASQASMGGVSQASMGGVSQASMGGVSQITMGGVSQASMAGPSMAAMPQPYPAEAAAPPSRSPLLWIGAILIVLLFGAIAAAVAFFVPFGGEERPETASAPAPSAPEPAPEPAPTAAVEPALGHVELVTEPPGVNVRHEDEDLGDTPLTLPIPSGERWRLTLSLEGYEPRTITVVHGQPAARVRLTAVAAEPVADSRPRPRNARDRVQPQQQQQPTYQPPPQNTWTPRNENRDPWAQ